MTTTAADPIEDVLVDLVDAVLELIDTPQSDPRYVDMELAVLDLCIAASTIPERPEPAELGVRIAELRAGGMGIRAIARRLGVHASTVSRRLRRQGKA